MATALGPLTGDRKAVREGRSHCAYCAVRASGACGALVGSGGGRSFLDPDATLAPLRTLEAGETIYHQGDRADRMFSLLSGWVALQQDAPDGERHILQFVLPGAAFGLEPQGGVFGHSAVTLTTATVCAIRRPRHNQLRHENPEFNERFLWFVLREVRLAQDTLGAIAHGSAATRVAHLLWELAVRSLGRRPAAGERVWAPITQVHLAQATGLTPIHVNRVLRRFRQKGLLDVRSQALTIHDPAALEQLSAASDDMVALWSASAAGQDMTPDEAPAQDRAAV